MCGDELNRCFTGENLKEVEEKWINTILINERNRCFFCGWREQEKKERCANEDENMERVKTDSEKSKKIVEDKRNNRARNSR